MAERSGPEMQAHLLMQMHSISLRIVEAARLAAAMHQLESLKASSEHYGQRVTIGGAGPVPPGAAEDSRLPHRPPRGEAVTDDESPAPPPPAADHGFTARRPPRYNPAD